MNVREGRLKKKGWTEEEITHLKSQLTQAEREKPLHKKIIEEIVLWTLLALISAGSLVGAWISQPLLLVLSAQQSLFALGFIGLLFGLFAGWIVAELEELEPHHHLFMTISIPVVTIISALLIHTRVQQIIAASPAFTITSHNPFLLAIVYTIATIIPYSLLLYLEKRRYETR